METKRSARLERHDVGTASCGSHDGANAFAGEQSSDFSAYARHGGVGEAGRLRPLGVDAPPRRCRYPAAVGRFHERMLSSVTMPGKRCACRSADSLAKLSGGGVTDADGDDQGLELRPSTLEVSHLLGVFAARFLVNGGGFLITTEQ
jgi:hypothetical protein